MRSQFAMEEGTHQVCGMGRGGWCGNFINADNLKC